MGGANEIYKEITADTTEIPECINSCMYGGCCCKCGGGLCIANSVCATNIGEDPSSSVSVTVPGKSCITKIYASDPFATNTKYMLVEVIDGSANPIFCHTLPNLGNDDPVFDTTLVQPLCVGDTDATAKVTAFGNTAPVNDKLTLTVVYCLNCC
ncbi:MAG: hypothetical protein ACERKV_12065 [Clostridiaceae bacterium]